MVVVAFAVRHFADDDAHGLRRSNADKRRAVLTLLNNEEWAKWSAREIAKACLRFIEFC